MQIHLVDVVLFLHIAVAVLAFGVAGLLLTALSQMRSAQSVAVLRTWQRMSHRVEPWFPIIVVVLIGLGAWLIGLSHKEFNWGDGWVITAVATLVIMEMYGGAVLAPNAKKLHHTLETIPDGPVPDHIRAAVLNPLVWAGAWGEMGLAAGILFVMPTKPSGAWPVLIVAVAGFVAVAIGYSLCRAAPSPRQAAAPVVAASAEPR
jgi:hypothetical protein